MYRLTADTFLVHYLYTVPLTWEHLGPCLKHIHLKHLTRLPLDKVISIYLIYSSPATSKETIETLVRAESSGDFSTVYSMLVDSDYLTMAPIKFWLPRSSILNWLLKFSPNDNSGANNNCEAKYSICINILLYGETSRYKLLECISNGSIRIPGTLNYDSIHLLSRCKGISDADNVRTIVKSCLLNGYLCPNYKYELTRQLLITRIHPTKLVLAFPELPRISNDNFAKLDSVSKIWLRGTNNYIIGGPNTLFIICHYLSKHRDPVTHKFPAALIEECEKAMEQYISVFGDPGHDMYQYNSMINHIRTREFVSY